MTKTRCAHHWRIETPRGPTCHAVCMRCGAESEFRTANEHQWITQTEAQNGAA
jgi:Fe2+ or Zn2+ uptake regulation protein